MEDSGELVKHTLYFAPRRPVGTILDVILAVSVKAFGGDALQRSVEISHHIQDPSSPDGRPVEEILVDRFIQHAGQRYTKSRQIFDEPLLFLSYQYKSLSFTKLFDRLMKGLPFLRLDAEEAIHVLYLEDVESAILFQRNLLALGTLHGDLHKGGILLTKNGVMWFIITWYPTIPVDELGRMLRTLLSQKQLMLTDDSRHSNLPPEPVSTPASSSRRSGSTSNPVVVPPPASSAKSPFAMASDILKDGNPPSPAPSTLKNRS